MICISPQIDHSQAKDFCCQVKNHIRTDLGCCIRTSLFSIVDGGVFMSICNLGLIETQIPWGT